MLVIKLPAVEMFDEVEGVFIDYEEATVRLEHSLVSLSKWESSWEKPFLASDNKSELEMMDYIKAMCLDDPPVDFISRLSQENINEISDYINAKKTATWFSNGPNNRSSSSGEVITSELIYYWMVTLNIPFECQHWHLNRLLTLIRVCTVKNQPSKKMSTQDIHSRNRELNAQRRAKYGTKG